MRMEESGLPPAGADKRGGRRYRFADAFSLAENGKLKSTLLLYSFSMAFLLLAVYAAAFLLLLRPLDALLSGRMPAPLASWLEGLIPGIAGTGLCALLQLRARDKRVMLLGYAWLSVMVIATLAALLSMLAPDDRAVYLSIAAPTVLPPLATGTAAAAILYLRHKKNAVPVRDAEGAIHESQR